MGYRWHFTDRTGGVSSGPYASNNLGLHVGDDPYAVAQNRQVTAENLGLGARRIVWMNQVHSRTIQVVNSSDAAAEITATDGIVTQDVDIALAVLVADCVPIIAADPDHGVVAAVHAGRVGAAAGIAESMVEQMVALGAKPDRLEVLLGPSICGACYEVPPTMQAEVHQALPGGASQTSAGTTGLDLRAGLSQQLRQLGVKDIQVDSRCTAEDSRLFSHRRDGKTGRQIGLVWLTVGVSQPE